MREEETEECFESQVLFMTIGEESMATNAKYFGSSEYIGKLCRGHVLPEHEELPHG